MIRLKVGRGFARRLFLFGDVTSRAHGRLVWTVSVISIIKLSSYGSLTIPIPIPIFETLKP
jgi:hypothetical protein